MSVTDFDFNTADSGYVRKQGFMYSTGIGANKCIIAKNSAIGREDRVVLRYNTSGIGAGATVTQIEISVWHSSAQPTPQSTSSTTLVGSWCGASLDGSANDFNASGASDTYTDLLPYGDGDWADLGTDGVNVTGITDVQIRDTTGPAGSYGHAFNTTKQNMQLRVTYTPAATANIMLRPLLGVGCWILGLLGVHLTPQRLWAKIAPRKRLVFQPL